MISYINYLKTYTYEDLCRAMDQRFGSERLATVFRAELKQRGGMSVRNAKHVRTLRNAPDVNIHVNSNRHNLTVKLEAGRIVVEPAGELSEDTRRRRLARKEGQINRM